MSSENKSKNYLEMRKETGTGSSGLTNDFRQIKYNFQNYEILVRLTQDGQFLSIDEVRVADNNRVFRQNVVKKEFSYIDEYCTK